MRSGQILVLLLVALIASGYPSKPLNERSTELSWQAWLLVDQSGRQNSNDPGNSSGIGGARRRITPKSVFIAPTFSPDTLPACAEGYRSDAMGRCIKIIKIDEAAHLDFLLERLNEQFGDYEEEIEEDITPGPYQFNIPLVGDDDTSGAATTSFENYTDLAIVVAPTTTSSTIKLDVKRTDNDRFNAKNVAELLGVRVEEVETTTLADLTTLSDTTITTITTTATETDETTVTAATELTSDTTTDIETTKFTTMTTRNSDFSETVGPTEETTSTTDGASDGTALFFQWRI